MKFYSPYSGLWVIRCDEDEHRQVWAAATLLTEIRNRVAAVRLVHLAGKSESGGLRRVTYT